MAIPVPEGILLPVFVQQSIPFVEIPSFGPSSEATAKVGFAVNKYRRTDDVSLIVEGVPTDVEADGPITDQEVTISHPMKPPGLNVACISN